MSENEPLKIGLVNSDGGILTNAEGHELLNQWLWYQSPNGQCRRLNDGADLRDVVEGRVGDPLPMIDAKIEYSESGTLWIGETVTYTCGHSLRFKSPLGDYQWKQEDPTGPCPECPPPLTPSSGRPSTVGAYTPRKDNNPMDTTNLSDDPTLIRFWPSTRQSYEFSVAPGVRREAGRAYDVASDSAQIIARKLGLMITHWDRTGSYERGVPAEFPFGPFEVPCSREGEGPAAYEARVRKYIAERYGWPLVTTPPPAQPERPEQDAGKRIKLINSQKEATVDDWNYERINQWQWYESPEGCARRVNDGAEMGAVVLGVVPDPVEKQLS